jgi:phage terminase large subunit-like protein
MWKRATIDQNRVLKAPPRLTKIVVAVDPPSNDPNVDANFAECGITVGGLDVGKHGYLLEDASKAASPRDWAREVARVFNAHLANYVVAEKNHGGEMVRSTIHAVDPNIPVKLVHASRGKETRAEPVSAKDEQGLIHHVGEFTELENQMCTWMPGSDSPDRMDARVWLFTELMIKPAAGAF